MSRAKALSEELKAEVHRRLGPTHGERIALLTQQLQASLAPHLAPGKLGSAAAPASRDAQKPPDKQPRLAEMFDQLLAAEEDRRLGVLAEDLMSMQQALDDARVDASAAHARREEAAQEAEGVFKAQEAQLRRLQHKHESMAQQLSAASTAKGAAERAAARAEARAQAAEAQVAAQGRELAELMSQSQQLAADKESALGEAETAAEAAMSRIEQVSTAHSA